jgi:hypothetical protein
MCHAWQSRAATGLAVGVGACRRWLASFVVRNAACCQRVTFVTTNIGDEDMLFRRLLMLSLLAVPLAGCLEAETTTEEERSTLDPAELAFLDPTTELDPEAAADPGQDCPDPRVALRSDDLTGDGSLEERLAEANPAVANGYDGYFHPNNGLHGGWIESWRLCRRGGNQYQICRGGYAPVRYWNPYACGGNVHDWYPQGWHGWVQTWGGCG